MILHASTIRVNKCKTTTRRAWGRDPESKEHGFGELVLLGVQLYQDPTSSGVHQILKVSPKTWSHPVDETLVHSRVYSGCKYKWRSGPFRAPSGPSNTVRITLPDEVLPHMSFCPQNPVANQEWLSKVTKKPRKPIPSPRFLG